MDKNTQKLLVHPRHFGKELHSFINCRKAAREGKTVYIPSPNKDEETIIMITKKRLDEVIQSAVSVERERGDKDIKFLSQRAINASKISFTGKRDSGISSNAIVRYAYGGTIPINGELPSDIYDLAACERMWKKLPKSRKTKRVIKSMYNARNFKAIRED